MEKKNKIIIIAIVLALAVLFSGLTYAYFTSATSSESGSTIVAKGGQMNVVYDNKSDNISVSNIYPREEAWVTKKFQVIGNNTTDLLMFYKVKLVVDKNGFGTDLSYTLTGTNTANSGALIPNISSNTHIGLNTVSLGTGYHVKGTSNVHDYTLQIFLKPSNNNQNYAQEANFAAHLVIEIDGTSTEKTPKNWDSAGSNTLLAGIKKNYANPTATLTNPMTDASSSSEAVMSLTPDDYGISYYFRGNVQNNFVSFAGMCWRIVRITGDGSIKLVLYDNSSANCTNTGGSLAYVSYDGETLESTFNFEADGGNAYIGFMYGTPNSTTYASTHANINKSTILDNLETWYTDNLTSYTSKLADTIWCNDKSTVKNTTLTKYIVTNGNLSKQTISLAGLGYQSKPTAYGSAVRNFALTQGTNKSYGTGPSLICPNDNDGGKLSKFTVDDTVNGNGNLNYKIGMLTVDEMILAGLPTSQVYENNGYSSNYVTSYLLKNATGWSYYTLSPAIIGYSSNDVWTIYNYGYLQTDSADTSGAIRPAISLKATTTISGGTGTASSPFIIN